MAEEKKTKQYPVIGKLAIAYKFITETQLEETLAAVAGENERGNPVALEQVLLETGLLTQDQFHFLQFTRDYFLVKNRDRLFCKIGSEKGLLTEEDVEKAFREQEKIFRSANRIARVGDILVKSKAISEKQRLSIVKELLGKKEKTTAVEKSDPASADLEISVSEDRLSAYILRKEDDHFSISTEKLQALLEDAGIRYGVLPEEEILSNAKGAGGKILVAAGKPPKPGADAFVHCNFDTEYLKAGKIDATGNIDFKQRGEIPHVRKGNLVAMKISRRSGENGVDVYGEPVAVEEARDCDIVCQGGVEVSDDGLSAYALIEGIPKSSFSAALSVNPEYVVNGDVSYETGHVEFQGNIFIRGSVQDGFRVQGDSIFADEILGAEICAKGDVVVSGGIIGAAIKAEGSVSANYIKGASIDVYRDVQVNKEILDSEITIGGECQVVAGNILSSVVSAKQGIVSKDIGNEKAKSSRLRVGIDDHADKEVQQATGNIEKQKEALDALRSALEQLEEEYDGTADQITEITRKKEGADREKTDLMHLVNKFKKRNKTIPHSAELMKDIEQRLQTAEDSLSALKERQSSLAEELNTMQNNISDAEKNVEQLEVQKEEILAWSSKEKGKPVIRVLGKIFTGTVIFTPNASVTLHETFHNVHIKETSTTEWGGAQAFHQIQVIGVR